MQASVCSEWVSQLAVAICACVKSRKVMPGGLEMRVAPGARRGGLTFLRMTMAQPADTVLHRLVEML